MKLVNVGSKDNTIMSQTLEQADRTDVGLRPVRELCHVQLTHFHAALGDEATQSNPTGTGSSPRSSAAGPPVDPRSGIALHPVSRDHETARTGGR